MSKPTNIVDDAEIIDIKDSDIGNLPDHLSYKVDKDDQAQAIREYNAVKNGFPRKLKLYKALIEYIDNNENPMLGEYCYLNNIPKKTLFQWRNQAYAGKKNGRDSRLLILDFDIAVAKALHKSEAYYQRLAKEKPNMLTFCIFALKCLAKWRDSEPRQSQTLNVTNINIPDVSKHSDAQLEKLSQQLMGETAKMLTAKSGSKG